MTTFSQFFDYYFPALVQIAAAVLFFAVVWLLLYIGMALIQYVKRKTNDY